MNENSASFRKVSIFKNNTNYFVKYTDLPRGTSEIKSSYKTKKLESKFTHRIKLFYYSAKAIKEKKQNKISTSNEIMFIRMDNKIFHVSDPNYSLGILYDNLIEDINGS